MRYLFFFLTLFSFSILAETNLQILHKWTIEKENKLIEKYKLIESPWFAQECLKLTLELEFFKIKSCNLIDSHHINAYVFNNGHVYFSLGMMQLIKNKHQWASILAHENAHVELKHYLKTLKMIKNPGVFFPKSKIKKLLKKNENEADQWSKIKIALYGYQPDQISYFFKRVKKQQVKIKNKHHLKISSRSKKSKQKEIINHNFIENILKLE